MQNSYLNKQRMNQVVTYLQSKEAIFHGAMCLMLLYVPHSGSLFMQLEHLDMTFFGFTFMNWIYGLARACIIEFLILIFIINGYKATGKFYAVVSFCLNICYYDYLFLVVRSPTEESVKTAIVSLLICLTHSLSVWQLSELFYERMTADKEKVEYWCPECKAGPFPNKRSLDGHISKAHNYKKKAKLPVRTAINSLIPKEPDALEVKA